jgi:hypothetical protein
VRVPIAAWKPTAAAAVVIGRSGAPIGGGPCVARSAAARSSARRAANSAARARIATGSARRAGAAA